jgi:hypothetical protein
VIGVSLIIGSFRQTSSLIDHELGEKGAFVAPLTHIGATACIVVTSFLSYYKKTKNWQALAWWIHDNIPAYSSMYFFPKLAAFNISWHQAKPQKRIDSYVRPRGCLTKPQMENHKIDHSGIYQEYIDSLDKR